MPSQQSLAALQAAPADRQHFPFEQFALSQQSLSLTQDPPGPLQPSEWHCPPVHWKPLQHSVFVAQVPPMVWHLHDPPTQAPVQQSVVAVQVAPAPAHAHLPAAQVPRQQSASELQADWEPWQARQRTPSQTVPVQQARPSVQSLPAPLQASTQWEALHSSPPQQGTVAQLAPRRPQPARQVFGNSPVTGDATASAAATQDTSPQQSTVSVHRSPAVLQRGSAQTPASHPPLQQSRSAVQAAPLARQPVAHAPLLQANPEQHSVSVAHAALELAHAHIP
jgi:hypothetical protein